MSFRFLAQRMFRHGRLLVQHYCRRDIHQQGANKILETRPGRNVAESLKRAQDLAQQQLRQQGIFRFGNQARRLFVDNVLGRVTNPYSAELRNQAARKFLYGDSAPFFALVGVSLATGSGLLTREDELEGVCYEIREAVQRFQNTWAEKELNENFTGGEELTLEDLSIGPPIAQGCSAVVYAAKLKDQGSAVPLEVPEQGTEVLSSPEPVASPTRPRIESPIPQMLSPIQNISRFIHNFGSSVDNLHEYDFDRVVSPAREVSFNPRERLYSAASYESFEEEEGIDYADPEGSIMNYPLALKIMFNYDIESNAMAILRAMNKETVPARRRNYENVSEWEQNLIRESLHLPPHPNIVAIYSVFCDRMPKLRHATKLFPMALPARLNPQGYGRNMSLFLLMKRYETSLKGFLETQDLPMRDRILLFAQLLEAITHLNRHGVAHRDLKSDNILIDDFTEGSAPVLVLSDFGCCLADRQHGLQIPYASSEMDKGGNTALMAPEIITKQPGILTKLDYSKSDLWACGAIAYEIFGQHNPFYQGLKNESYTESQLPELGSEVPVIIQKVVQGMLTRSPWKRLSTEKAANIVQLYLWAPSRWLLGGKMPSNNEILQWLLCLTTKTLCETRVTSYDSTGRRTHTEYLLISSFLARARLNQIKNAFNWIHNL